MKKVTLKDLNGKEIETYFVSNHPNNFPTDMENHTVEDVPSDKDWFDMTGGEAVKGLPLDETWGYDDPDHPLNKHDEGQMYNMNEQDVNENSAGGGAHVDSWKKGYKEEGQGKVWSALTKALLNKIKLQEPESQINIDDSIPSDFLDTTNLRLGCLYIVGGLGLVARFVAQITIPENKCLLQMKRHGIIFYVEERQLLKANKLQVEQYLNEPF